MTDHLTISHEDWYGTDKVNSLNFSAIWSDADEEYVGACKQYPSVSYRASDLTSAMLGIRDLINHMRLRETR